MNEITAEQIAKNYSAAMDSVNLINFAVSVGQHVDFSINAVFAYADARADDFHFEALAQDFGHRRQSQTFSETAEFIA
jgi:hypothetical protein